jgi:GGDEF domain-containing protein
VRTADPVVRPVHFALFSCTTLHREVWDMSETADGYRLLGRLRALERQLRRLRKDWGAFREEPCPETLAEVQARTRRFAAALEALAITVEDVAPSARSTDRVSSGDGTTRARPAPRDVVTASRDLDARVWEAAQRWKGVLDGNGGADLDRLVSVLEDSADRLGTLIMALGGDRPDRRPSRSVAAVESTNAEVYIEATAAELEGMLWRLQADWQQVRRAPTVARLRVLMESFEQAASTAAGLRELRGRTGQSRFQHSLRVGRHLTDGVRFLPYRDPFTGIYNREGFDALAEAELKRCRRYDRGFGLLILEISPPDLAGLQRAVATARAELREYDLIARYVDDLVFIGVPEGGGGATRRVASRVLRALRAGDMGTWFRQLSYAILPDDGSTLSGLIHTARQRLQP